MAADAVVEILVHPLVLLNISDYHTRLKLISENPSRVAGICLGTQEGRQVSIETTFELLLETTTESKIACDLAFLEARLDQYKQVFPNLEAVGWYTIGSDLGDWEASLQQVLSGRFDSPLVLVLNPAQLDSAQQHNASDIPLKIYETSLEVIQGTDGTDADARKRLVELSWRLETSEVERIAVGHVSKAQPPGNSDASEEDRKDSSLIAHYNTQASAIKVLHSRISLLRAYLEDVEAGKIEADISIIRRISALLQRVPLMQSADFASESKQEQGDVLLTQQLDELMQGSLALSNLIDMFSTVSTQSKRGGRRTVAWNGETGSLPTY